MGLDINAYIFDGDTPIENGRLVQDENWYHDKEEVAYWRSFNELRSWLIGIAGFQASQPCSRDREGGPSKGKE